MIRRPPISTRLTHSFPTRRSSDLASAASITGLWGDAAQTVALLQAAIQGLPGPAGTPGTNGVDGIDGTDGKLVEFVWQRAAAAPPAPAGNGIRSEEHTSELQSLMRISYAVFCLKKTKQPICFEQIHNT